jgi:hypothetical protein
MNETGIWTGMLSNGKIGTFKFINVNLVENSSDQSKTLIDSFLRDYDLEVGIYFLTDSKYFVKIRHDTGHVG